MHTGSVSICVFLFVKHIVNIAVTALQGDSTLPAGAKQVFRPRDKSFCTERTSNAVRFPQCVISV